MKIKYKVIEFKSVSPLFEMERDGIKPFTTRLADYHDPRFRALAQWRPGCNWLIKITNPAPEISPLAQEYFYRKLIGVRWLPGPSRYSTLEPWRILYLGEEIKGE